MKYLKHGSATRLTAKLLTLLRCALVACIAAQSAYAAPQIAETLAFSTSPRGHILVPVSIEGSEPLVFVLDTGAGKTVVTPKLVDSLGLSKVSDETQTTVGVHGVTKNVMIELPPVSVGEASAAGLQAVMLDLEHITRGQWRADGILGMDFLSRFDVRLDFAASELSLFSSSDSDGSASGACATGADGIAFETIEPGFIVLPATVDEKPVSALLDTGSGHSGINTKAALAMGVTLPPMPAGASAGHGFGLQTGPVRVGDTLLTERTTLAVMDHPVMESLGLADRPNMLMGTDQLAGQVLTICYGLKTLLLQ
jgi:predicted aspartyl protease